MMPSAKRLPPDPVPPVTIGEVRYEVIHWGRDHGLDQNGGYIAARDVASGKELWTLKVYNIDYESEGLESDLQDIFITEMKKDPSGARLAITDEDGRSFLVDPATRTVTAGG